jgi:hypothetical protein
MAQGDTVTIDINERVEATFQLDFKKADVQSRPDAANFAELVFVMRVAARTFSHFPRPQNTPHANPTFIDLTAAADDSVVRVVFSFVGNKDDGTPRFLDGDAVDLSCTFASKNGDSSGVDPILLGTAKIQNAKPKP